VLLLLPAKEDAKFMMRVFNADGSEASMCGNAVRCLARFLLDEKLIEGELDTPIPILTKSGIKSIRVLTKGSDFVGVAVDMGFALSLPLLQPLLLSQPPKESITVGGKELSFVPVSMGNPHAVFFDQPIDAAVVKEANRHPLFGSAGVNVGFCSVESVSIDRVHLRLQVWERGAGLTKACGTGACAAAVAYFIHHNTGTCPSFLVSLPGGDLFINLKQENDAIRVFKTGPAEYEFSGILSLVETR
jgi:diaminopimelate epimerase